MPAYPINRVVQPATVAHADAAAYAGSDETPTKEKQTKIAPRFTMSPINKVPKAYLIDAVDEVSAQVLDATLTGNCDQDELAVILWLLGRVQPKMKISDLRCEYYDEVSDRFKRAAKRVRDDDPAAWKFMVAKIVTLLGNGQVSLILEYALEQGFDPEWLVCKKKTKQDKVSKRMTTMMENATKAAIGDSDDDESSVS